MVDERYPNMGQIQEIFRIYRSQLIDMERRGVLGTVHRDSRGWRRYTAENIAKLIKWYEVARGEPTDDMYELLERVKLLG